MGYAKRMAEIAREKKKFHDPTIPTRKLEDDYPHLAAAMATTGPDGESKAPLRVGFYCSQGTFRARLKDVEHGLVAFVTIIEPTRFLEELDRKLEVPETIDWRIDEWNGKFSLDK